MTSTSSPIENILELARRVRTQEGARLYGRPIGSLINDDQVVGGANAPQNAPASSRQFALPKNATPTGPAAAKDDASAPTKTVTLERLKSIQRMIRQAAKVDDTSQIKKLEKEFSEALTIYGKDRPAAQVIADLSAPARKK